MKKIISLILCLGIFLLNNASVFAVEQEASSDYLLNIDFSEYYDENADSNLYSVAELQAKGASISGESVQAEISSDGMATLSFDSTKSARRVGAMYFGMPTGKTRGIFEFDIKFKGSSTSYGGSYGTDTKRYIFGLSADNDSSGQVIGLAKDGSEGAVTYSDSVNFSNGKNYYNPQDEGPYEFKIVVKSISVEDDWTITVYDKNVSLETPILTKVESRSNVENLDKVGMKWWKGTSSQPTSLLVYSITCKEIELEKTKVTSNSFENGVGTVNPSGSLTFSDALKDENANIEKIAVVNSAGEDMVLSRSLSNDKYTVNLMLNALDEDETYTIIVPDTVKDTYGAYVQSYSYDFSPDSELDILFKVDFSDYKNQTLTTSELNVLTNGVIRSDANTKVVIDENGVGKVTDNDVEAINTTISMVYDLPQAVESGCVHFDLDIAGWWYEEGGYEVAHHLLRIDNNELFGIGKQGPMLYTKDGLTFAGGNSSYNPTIDGSASFKFRIEVMSADETSDWTVNVYHTEKSLADPILTTIFTRAALPEITYIGSGYWVSKDCYKLSHISYNSVSAKLKRIKIPSVKEIILPDENIEVVFPENLTAQELSGSELILKTKDGVEINSEISLNENVITLKPGEYLKYNSEYELIYKDLTDVDGDHYRGNLKILTASKDLFVKSVTNKYYSAENIETTLDSAKKIVSNIVLDNSDGNNNTVFAVSTAYDENGLLVGIGVSEKITTSSSEIPIGITVQNLEATAKTVNTAVFQVKNNIITKIN